MFNCLTKEEILVCLKYWLDTALVMFSMVDGLGAGGPSYARTLENSEVGDMTKLSFVLDHEIKCWIV